LGVGDENLTNKNFSKKNGGQRASNQVHGQNMEIDKENASNNNNV
jgi:hypothetical protein